ncbi:hypothetical protein [Wolbachia endosymbiont of Pentidionis agamae]|uniref:hypothetical protein n=1 Tax=Wolbachia endosymbiont of Pentidionis agamae TaxID=3110435 RepID=UPI002FD76315
MSTFIDQNQELKRKYISITSIPGVNGHYFDLLICLKLGTLQEKQISSLAWGFNRDLVKEKDVFSVTS